MDSMTLVHSTQYSLNPKSSYTFCAAAPSRPSFFSHRLVKHKSYPTIVAAARKENKKNLNTNKKDRAHSFVARPNEAIGPFPEAVLLKERKVEEDGSRMPEFADVEERELFTALNLQLESERAVELMRHYEVVYLIHENHKEEVENVNMKIQEFLKEKKGKVWRFSDWGMRRLAYKIQKAKNAHYILMNFEIGAQWINDFKSMLDKDERIIRHMVIKKDEAETEDCPPPPEFHTLRGEMNNDGEEDADYDDEEYDDDEYDDEEYDEEDMEDDGDVDEETDGIIYVDDDDDGDSSSSGRSKQKAQTVGHQFLELSESSGSAR